MIEGNEMTEELTIKDKSLFLLDMDGTLYLGNKLFKGTKEFLEHLKKSGIPYVFMTNNSSKGVESYLSKLKRLGIQATKEQFMTSVDATLDVLKHRYSEEIQEKKIYVVGTNSLKTHLISEGLRIVEYEDYGDFVNRRSKGEEIDILLLGYDTELNYEKLRIASELLTLKVEGFAEEETRSSIKYRVDYIATNPDWVCPTENGFVPDCGAMAEMLEHAVKRLPEFIGKPEPHIVNLALSRFNKKAEDAVIIGDRLYTDILCGKKSGISSIFVLSGEGTLNDLKFSQAEPTWIMKNIEEVYEALK